MLITGTEKLLSLDVRGQIGFTAGCGMARAGYSRCGASKDFGGIYQRKKTRTGWGLSRMRYYRPTNPQSEAQQSRRALLAEGWPVYMALTDEVKVLLSKQARLLRMSGPNLFMRKWLKGEI